MSDVLLLTIWTILLIAMWVATGLWHWALVRRQRALNEYEADLHREARRLDREWSVLSRRLSRAWATRRRDPAPPSPDRLTIAIDDLHKGDQ